MDGKDDRTTSVRRRSLVASLSSRLRFGWAALLWSALPAQAQGRALLGDQPGWRFCSKCGVLFFSGAADKGRCAAGGAHMPQGYLFALHFDSRQAGQQRLQYAWRHCEKCRGVFYDGLADKGRCPAGAGHQAQGLMFGLDFQPPAARHQPEWRYCEKCKLLFFNGFPEKGRCAAGGAHRAQGYTFHLLYQEASADPGRAISDLLPALIEANRPAFERRIVEQLGRGDMIRPGVTLYNINFRLGKPVFSYASNRFDYRLNDNYLYFKSTTPTAMGSYGDPAFELHFDAALQGSVTLPPGRKPRVDTVEASIPRIHVAPRNVAGGIVTTIVSFFQKSEAGGRLIQQAHDRYLKADLTHKINEQLERF